MALHGLEKAWIRTRALWVRIFCQPMKLLDVCSSRQYNYLWAIKYSEIIEFGCCAQKIDFYTCILKGSVFSYCFSLSTEKNEKQQC